MLYPSIQELLKATEKDGKERLNKYSITMATAKCARVITNEYAEQSYYASKKSGKDNDSGVKKEYKDEKSVKNALREMKEGEFEIYLPGEEGYDESMVEIKNYVEPKEEPVYYKPVQRVELDKEENDEDYDDFDDEEIEDEEEISTEELMGAENVYEENSGFSIDEAE
ncbi:MAG: DNA-directed RNA polymerase subunit omega [Ruminococcaceae bacterium]|nr:DNA-directed RNA polymerase subunit omega [Oscillospiraceae bacterium]